MGEHNKIEKAFFLIKDEFDNHNFIQIEDIKDFEINNSMSESIYNNETIILSAQSISVTCTLSKNSINKFLKKYRIKPQTKRRYNKNKRGYRKYEKD